MQIRKRIVGVGLSAALLGSVLGVPAAQAIPETNNFSATCDPDGSSAFTNGSKAAFYTWVWREGTTVLAYGAGRLARNETKTLSTPSGSGGEVIFGVVKSNGQFAYIVCED